MIKSETECTNCGWRGTDDQKIERMDTLFTGAMVSTCPMCGCIEFYMQPTPQKHEMITAADIVGFKYAYQLN